MNNKSPATSIRTSNGQALSELLVSMAVIAPFFLLIPVLANYLDVQTANHEAARYVAWERTAYENLPADIQAKVQERFLLKESSGFSSGSIGENDVRWRDYGRTDGSVVVDLNQDVGIDQEYMALNVNDPVTNSSIDAVQAMNSDAYGKSSVSFPLDSDGYLFAVFSSGANYLKSNRTGVATPSDSVDGSSRFHTKSAVAILADGGIVPKNEEDFTNTITGGGGKEGFVTTDEGPLNFFEAPLRLFHFVFSGVGLFKELDILYEDDGGLRAVADGQSEILPDGLIEYTP